MFVSIVMYLYKILYHFTWFNLHLDERKNDKEKYRKKGEKKKREEEKEENKKTRWYI